MREEFFFPFFYFFSVSNDENERGKSTVLPQRKIFNENCGDEDGKFVFASVCECISDGSFSMRNRKSIMEMFFHDICNKKKA